MNEEHDEKDEKDETVFQPSQFGRKPADADAPGAPGPPIPSAPVPSTAEGAEEEGTVFAASPSSVLPPAAPPPAEDAGEEGTVFAAPGAVSRAPPPEYTPPMTAPPAASSRRGNTSPIDVGAVLNHMFEVRRFLARGGMGEVFEAVNIASGERVAIKVILPELAADPNVMAMFQKEAQALTNLSHPAVVRYRGFALEPQLGCYYIATGFIDGRNLSDVLGKSTLSEDELFELARRLAEGLKEAHELGVVHRDISPDNVILDGDRLDRPKIIDFGIVKETDPGSKTIIGDGFAGKPSYVAPEQLGDFDKQVGPWSDIYSLALVILAMAQGRKPDLGGLPAEAIMKRRSGVDTSAVPARLRPVIDSMLAADPQQRLRSMDEVIAALDQAKAGKGPRPPKAKTPKRPAATGQAGRGMKLPPRPYLVGGGALLGTVLLASIGYLTLSGGEVVIGDTDTAQTASAAPGASLEHVDGAVQAALPSIPCSWMTVRTARDGSGYSVIASGVAGAPLEAENGILQAARKAGAEPGTDFGGIARIDQSYCPILDELGKFRDSSAERMTRKQPEYELDLVEQGEYAGQIGTHVVTDLALDGITGDYALYSIEKSNVITQFVADRSVLPQNVNGASIQKLPGIENYRLDIETNAKPGWAGIVLITGKGSFTPDALSDLATPAGKAAFEQRAKANDWKVQIVWYKFIDNQPNTGTGAGTAAAPSAPPAASY
ncbi:serine/threonine protein kinase [Novosphingobium sp. CF614]|uniref:serine/threonine protein kinase n=1 Tax=Novosphingobium sp. CF614 TaxID=1884364 RepID=UPI0008E5F12E|nr:serine/threonine-protein kinase [Novosphingobium sp. CF614]SFG05357.1 serine/threonine protein kinase [Novosphingobium sp. CF614]